MSTEANKLKGKLRDMLYFKSNLESDEERNRMLTELTTSAEARHQKCLASIYRARGYIDWFATSSATSKSREQLESYRKFFAFKEKASEDKALNSSQAEKQLRDYINRVKAVPSQENTYMMQFIEAVRDHLAIKKQILQREADLANEFLMVSQNFIRQNLRLLSKSDHETLLAVAKCVKLLKNGELSAQELKNMTAEKLNSMLEVFNERLQDQYQLVNEVQQIMAQIELLLQKVQLDTHQEDPPQSQPSERASDSGMVYKKDNS